MAQINLIPEKRKNGQESTAFSRKLQKINTILVTIFVVALVAGGAYLFINNQILKSETARYEQLKNEVLSLQENEARLLLLRERLDKAEGILSDREQYKSLSFFSQISKSFPEGVVISEILVEKGVNKLTLSVPNSQALSEVVAKIEQTSDYPNITVDDITYNAQVGYLVTILVI